MKQALGSNLKEVTEFVCLNCKGFITFNNQMCQQLAFVGRNFTVQGFKN